MLTALLLTATVAAGSLQEPSVKVWTNKDDVLDRGERARVYVRTADDGYVLVLHAEPDGRIRVLFPLDPGDDNFIRGGQRLEVRGRGDREAFRVFEDQGMGALFAAFSRDPFVFGEYVLAGHWDYRALEEWRLSGERDQEAELVALTQRLGGQTFFEYDVVSYMVGRAVAHGGHTHGIYSGVGYRGWDHWDWGFSFGVSWGRPYAWVGCCGFPYWYNPAVYWYDPFYYGGYWAWYDPYYYYHPYYRPYRYRYAAYYYYDPYPSWYEYRRARYYWPAYGSTIVLRKYTPKTDQGSSLSGGVGMRKRSAESVSAAGRRSPGAVQLAGPIRRAAVTSAETPSRRGAEPSRLTPARRVVEQSTERRAVNGPAESGRRVMPQGWGVSDGERIVTPRRVTVDRPDRAGDAPRRGTPDVRRERSGDAQAPARRTVTPEVGRPGGTVDQPRRATPEGDVGSQLRRATPSGSTEPRRVTPPSQRRDALSVPTPSLRREAPSQPRRVSPTRDTTPRTGTLVAPSGSQPARRTISAPAAAPRSSPPRVSRPAPVVRRPAVQSSGRRKGN